MERGNEWSVRVAHGIGKRVAYYRSKADLTASMVSARCGELGLPLDRNVIAKIERGHRNSVTVDEVCVLAAALNVAPLQLLFGVGTEDEAEPLPGEVREPFRAAQWFTGERPFPGKDDGAYLDGIADDWGYASGSPLWLYRSHSAAEAGEREALRRAAGMEAQASGPRSEGFAAAAAALREQAGSSRAAAENARRRASELGWLPPG
jgi:transcriptional regulator with XRE-family HTH domain